MHGITLYHVLRMLLTGTAGIDLIKIMGTIRFIKPLHKELLGQQLPRYRQFDSQRPNSSKRGYDARHRKWRAVILAIHPVCVICRSAASTHADHRIPIRLGGSPYDYANGQGLCASCHNRKTRTIDTPLIQAAKGINNGINT